MLNSEIIIRRLAIIKYLYKIGIQQSMQVESVAGFSILTFHDCIEMFLLLVAEHNNVKAEYEFMNYWDTFPNLTSKESMKALKARRVNIKHKGLFPSKSDVEISRINVIDFFEQNTKIQFNLDFKQISLLDLLMDSEAKTLLRSAEESMNQNSFDESLLQTKRSFNKLINSYKENGKHLWYGNIFNIGREINNRYERIVGTNPIDSAWFRDITKTTNKLRDVLNIIALGIDYKRYAAFSFLTPTVHEHFEGDYSSTPISSRGIKVDRDTCLFCINFVLDCALKLQDFHFDLKDYIQDISSQP
jgi:hypothetical protein